MSSFTFCWYFSSVKAFLYLIYSIKHVKERYFFPIDGDWKKKQASNKEASRYYHADPGCVQPRFPYFTKDSRGGYSSEFLVGVCRPGLQIPTLFQT